MGPVRRNAVLFVAVSVLSDFGGNAMALVTGVWLLDLTRSSSLAALAGLGVYAPQLAGPWLGGLLDRVPRRLLVVGVNLAMAAILMTLLGMHTTWHLFAVSLAYGVSHVLGDAGDTALLPSALSPAQLTRVNGWRSSAQEGMKLVALRHTFDGFNRDDRGFCEDYSSAPHVDDGIRGTQIDSQAGRSKREPIKIGQAG